MLLIWTALAAATPPPLVPRSTEARLSGFERLYVDPDVFAERLRPLDAPALPPRPRAILVLQVDASALEERGLELEQVQETIAAWEGVSDVRLDTEGVAVTWSAPTPRVPAETIASHELEDLGTVRAFPASWTPQPPPRPVLGDLAITNDTLVRVEVVIADTRVGSLLAGTTGTVHRVRAGRYPIVLVTPDGFEHAAEQRTTTPAPAPAPAR